MSAQPKPHILFRRDEIETTLRRLAVEISKDYKGKCPLFIGVLKGSFVFLADLIRLLDFPLEVDFVRLSSYGCGQQSSGKIEVLQGLHCEVKHRNILVVEDIVDTGHTVANLLDYLQKRNPKSLKLCSLTDKPSRREVPVTIDYLGFTVPDKFIVGYGMDWGGKFRYLPDLCYLKERQ